MIKFPCPLCGTNLKAPDGTENQTSICCHCRNEVIIPLMLVDDEPASDEGGGVEVPRKSRRSRFRCPFCGSDTTPVTEEEISGVGWAVMVAFLFICFPLFFIGLLIKNRYRVCRDCGTRIGSV